MGSEAASRINPPHSTTVLKYGSSKSPCPTCSITAMTSTPLPPSPPNSSGKGSANKPEFGVALPGLGGKSQRRARERAAALEIVVAGNEALQGVLQRQLLFGITEIHDSPPSKTQDQFRNDVLLDFRRARIDRGLAQVEILAGQRRRILRIVLREQRRRRPIQLQRISDIGQRVVSQGMHLQLGELLDDLRALDFQNRGLRPRGARLARLGRQHSQIGDLERHQLELDLGDAIAKARILDERPAVHHLRAGDVF